MNALTLLIDKIIVIILLVFLYADSLSGVTIPLIAYAIPLIITGTLRNFLVLLVLIMDLVSYANEKNKKINWKFWRSKNNSKG